MKLPVTKTKIQICQTEIGALGHIANWAYVKYMQFGRTDFMQAINGNTGYDNAPLVANLNVDFYFACFPGDDIEVVTWCSRLGRKSFHVSSAIYANGKLAVKGEATCVGYNRASGRTELLPDDWEISEYAQLGE